MNYRPPSSYHLGDCWVFIWEGLYHLFHLQATDSGWGGLGHAISQDFVHWIPQDTIKIEEVPNSWEASVGLTGTIVRHEGKFWMFYGAYNEGIQRIGAIISDDMKSWEKHPNNPLIVPAAPYQAAVREEEAPPQWRDVWWRDPVIYWRKDLECYEGLIGARMPNIGPDNSGACIARVRSKDLVNWEHFPPLADVGSKLLVADVPDIFEMNGTWYLTFNTCSSLGRRLDTPTRKQVGGTYYMIAPSPDGPFEFPEDPCLLGSGNGRQGPSVLATLPLDDHNDKRLAYHVIFPSPLVSGVMSAFALPKYLYQNKDLTLSLLYHPVIEKLETRVIQTSFADMDFNRRFQLTGQWLTGKDACSTGQRLHGYSVTASSAVLCKDVIADIHLSCHVDLHESERCGVLLRFDQGKASGLAVTLDKANQEVSFGQVGTNWFGSLYFRICHIYDSVRWDLPDNRQILLRIVVRAEFAEVYIDDRLALCVSIPGELQTGVVGYFVEGGKSSFGNMRLAELETLLSL